MDHMAVEELERRIDADLATLQALGSAADSAEAMDLIHRLDSRTARIEAIRMDILHKAAATALPGNDISAQLHNTNRVTLAVARGQVRSANQMIEKFPIIHRALADGQVSPDQARAIVRGLLRAPGSVTSDGHDLRQAEMVRYAASFDPAELEKLAVRMAEVTDPEHAEALAAARLEREQRLAHAARSLTVVPDHHGSMLIRGQIPLADGEVLLAQLTALLPSRESYTDSAEAPTRPMRQADALVRLTTITANHGELPANGGDRPHATITLDHETLTTGLGRVISLGTGEHLAPSVARRIACEANIIPVVLGTDSQPLDVGRQTRFFTGAVGRALVLRDQGCVFPGCDAMPAACHRHHILPWWQGGATSLDNGVLVCAFHHRLVEPDPEKSPDLQWQIHLDEGTGLPWFTPPRHIDPNRAPRQHRRHRLRRLESDLANEFEIEDSPAVGEDSARTPTIRFPEPHEDPWHPDYQSCVTAPSSLTHQT